MNETRLTETEREAIESAAIAVNGYFPDDLFAAVEAILTARLAKVAALADDVRGLVENATVGQVIGTDATFVAAHIENRLRAALSGDPGPDVMSNGSVRPEPAAPCGCGWDGDHCPHCGTVCHPSGDGWSPAHTLRCHRLIPPGSTHPGPEDTSSEKEHR